jgi:hypothetical protein
VIAVGVGDPADPPPPPHAVKAKAAAKTVSQEASLSRDFNLDVKKSVINPLLDFYIDVQQETAREEFRVKKTTLGL